jgi:hypothetical protein
VTSASDKNRDGKTGLKGGPALKNVANRVRIDVQEAIPDMTI